MAYADPAKRQFLPADWTLDNFDQRRMKTQGVYESTVEWVGPSGETIKTSFVTHDLKLIHQSSPGVMWVRVLPLPSSMATKTLNAIAEDWVNGLNGTVLDFTFSRPVGSQRVATKMIESKPAQVSGCPAHAVTFDLANLDQLEMDAQAPRTRVRALFINAPLFTDFGYAKAPSCLFVAYANDSRSFDKHIPLFEQLLGRIQIRKSPEPLLALGSHMRRQRRFRHDFTLSAAHS